MVRVLDAFDLPHECERIGQADVQVCQTGARDVLAGIVGEIVAECRIERSRRRILYMCGSLSRSWIESFAASTAAMISSSSVPLRSRDSSNFRGQEALLPSRRPDNEDVGTQVGREKSRAELARCCWPSGAVFRPAFEETCSIRKRIFSAENAPPLCLKVTCASEPSRSASMRTLDLAADIHVLGVLDQLPDPTLRCRRRRVHAGAELRQFLVDFRRDIPVMGLLFEAENCDLNVRTADPLRSSLPNATFSSRLF